MSAGPLRLQTPRLVMRPLEPSDGPDLSRIGGQPEVARMMSTVRSPWLEVDVQNWIARSAWTGNPGFRLAVCLRNGTLIGVVGIGSEDPPSCAYFIDPACAGQGYATEAMTALLADAFVRFGLTEIVADHFAENPVSGRVLVKLGFVRIGEGIGESAARLEPAPIVHYRLTRTERET